MQTVVVLSRLATKASESGKLQDFIGYLIGAFAQANTELLKHDEGEACSILAHLADITLKDCGEVPTGATVQ